ncbi:hypothetical protein M407DRAFT_33344 [Tulasnella calospora MUT 4182]|uniref:Uncharacterized protein n=1 Tax=Tulasnella calospora MUT 4182 TaxID=1051891 RepID=A0A0C3PQX2_9AGAM|nr:hypothetical protein M407DRAFT_33344 [Tulasnella calospora MUT 4182]
MARIDPEPDDFSGPPAYNEGEYNLMRLKRARSYKFETGLTPRCFDSQIRNPSPAQYVEHVPCSACHNNPAIAAMTLRCGHSICSFHLGFFIDGFRTWQAQQGASTSPALTETGAALHPPVESLATLSLSTISETHGPSGSTDELVAGGAILAPSELLSASDDTPFINPDLKPVAPQPLVQPFSSSTSTESPYPDPSSPSSASESSESSGTSYGSWTADEAAEANELMAAYEAREFGNEAEVDWLYNNVEMHNAEAQENAN